MSELIDREALKDAVKRYAGEPIKKKDRKCQAICLDMLGTIDAQPAASPWHRVEDELPEKEGDYLVWTMLYGGHAYTDYYTPKYGWDEYKVIAWMPLPEPPKE